VTGLKLKGAQAAKGHRHTKAEQKKSVESPVGDVLKAVDNAVGVVVRPVDKK
jgi:hypothetical protein